MTPSTGTKPLPMSELTVTAIAILCRELGPVDTARFINHFSNGMGNYTTERSNTADAQSVDSIVAAIERQRTDGKSRS